MGLRLDRGIERASRKPWAAALLVLRLLCLLLGVRAVKPGSAFDITQRFSHLRDMNLNTRRSHLRQDGSKIQIALLQGPEEVVMVFL